MLTKEEIERVVGTVEGGALNVQDIYPLAPLQEGILFHHLLAREGDPYLLRSVQRFDSRARLDGFVAALQAVIDRHDILRTAVVWEGLREPVQVVWRSAPLVVEEVAFDLAAGDAVAQLAARFDPRHYRMDVQRAPLLRVAVARDESSERWIMVLLFHHLVSDRTASEVIFAEIGAHLMGAEATLPKPLPFRNYIAQARFGVSREEHESFFTEMLGDVAEPTAPFGLTDVQGDGAGIAQAQRVLDPSLAKRLREQARVLGVSTASMCHLAWARVLGALSGRDDVVFGTVLFGRMQGGEGSDRAVGLFINTLPLRLQVGEGGVKESVRRTHDALAELMRHEHASLALAQRCSAVVAPAPLFSALLNYRHMRHAGRAADVRRAWEGIEFLGGQDRSNYPLILSVDDFGDGLRLLAQVVAAVDPERICGYMETALEQLADALDRAPSTPVRNLGVLPASERRQLVVDWNTTEASYPPERCIPELFEAQAAKAPDAVAVVYEDAQLTYGELNARANRLARHLRSVGVGPDARVALCAERSIEMVVGLLAVLKAGGAYVPLDPSYPLERLSYMLADSAPVAVLTHDAVPGPVQEMLRGAGVAVIDLQRDATRWASEPASNVDRTGLMPEHLAYVIYTSGTTGHPKGVMVEHANVVRLFAATEDWFHFDDRDVWTLFHSFAFDFSVWEIWGALLHGGRLVVVPHLTTRSPREFYALVCDEGVTILNQTPSAFRQLIEAQTETGQAHQLRAVIFGGEALDPTTLAPWFERAGNARARLVNMYGITETTVHVTHHPIEPDRLLSTSGSPIGRRLPDLRVYIVDEAREPVPIGVAGELYVGGAGVTRGYFNRPELTAERFVPSPFVAGDRLYKTGDLARYLADGTIEYLGRNDFQVKLRGFRIELGEIESRLREHERLRDVVVLVREDAPGEKRLVAYYTLRDAGEISVEDLRSHVLGALPEHMVPAAYVCMEALPLTPNGKLDRKGLPAPEGSAYVVRAYEAPLGEVEQTIARIWSEVLEVEGIGRHDNFFELGGHSLLAVRVLSQMRAAGVHSDIRALFSSPTLSSFAGAVGGESGVVEVPPNGIAPGSTTIAPAMLPLVDLSEGEIERVVGTVPGGARNVQDIYPLAPLQEGILFHHLLAREGDPYVLRSVHRFDSRARLDGFVAALQAVIDRHDILRTAVVWEGLREPVQVVWRQARLVVEEVTCDPAAGDVVKQLAARFDPRHYRLDVRQAPLFRVAVARDATSDRWIMVLLFHHLVDDNTSLRAVFHEIEAHLLGEEAQLPKSLPFRNFVAQARFGVSREEHESFFTAMLADVDEPTAPFGLTDVQGDGSGITQARRVLDPSLSKRLRDSARVLGVSTASMCHLAWARVLGALSGREDVVFGTVLFGRMQGGEGSDRAVGLFINTLPLRLQVGEGGVKESVRRTHDALAELMRHEHASLGLAQRCSAVVAPAPLFSALLNYRHIRRTDPTAEARRAWEGIEPLGSEERTNYPLILSVDDLGDALGLTAQVAASVDPERICAYMQTALEQLVDALDRAPSTPVRKLNILSASERRRIVVDWNATEPPYPSERCIHELFEAQAAKTPDAVAVVYEDAQLTYGELNAQANRLARYLRSVGVGPDARVALCVERSIEMVVGLLAVLKAGGAYVPLDPAYPVERLRYMLADSAPRAVLTHDAVSGSVQELLRASGVAVIDLQRDVTRWARESASNVDRAGLTPEHLAYVIYTSGTTGNPKGVMNEHHAVVNRLCWSQAVYALGPGDRVLQKTPFSFDVSVWEFFWPLLSGAGLVMARPEGHRDPGYLVEVIDAQQITMVHFVPSMLRAFLDAVEPESCSSLRRVICSGEALSGSLTQLVQGCLPRAELLNFYGPTEAAVEVTAWRCRVETQPESTPIGRPIWNTRIYILDAHDEPVPVGVAGELHIGGVPVARGYLNRPELTAERFVPSPFVAGDRLYKTGDLARYLPDGNIEYLGRNDFQVKIRGFRIELGEIEARLREHEPVRDVVVVAREDVSGEKRLVAYYTLRGAGEVRVEDLRLHMLAVLPEYMVPAAYVCLEALPLTPSGKLDRAGLPAPEGSAYVARAYEAPLGEVEQTIARIWSEVLEVGVEGIGRHDNFFELGGHSLLAVRVLSQMRAAGVHSDIRALFSSPTLTSFADAVGAESGLVEVPPNGIRSDSTTITPAMLPLVELSEAEIERVVATVPGGALNVQDIYPLAPLQEGILFHHLLTREGDPYLLRTVQRFDSRARFDGFVAALQAVIDRHDSLRTAVVWEGLHEPVQVVWRQARLVVEEVACDPAAGDVVQQLAARFDPHHYRLDVQQAPLFRVAAARDESSDRWIMVLLFHHLVSDHMALQTIFEEIEAHLQGEQATLPQSAPFRNFVAQARLGVSREEHEAFFTEMLSGVDAPTAPFGLIDVQGDGSGIAQAERVVDPSLSRRLRERARILGVSTASICHLAWARVLGALSDRDDVVFGTVLFGRMQGGEGSERTVGLLMNTLPLRLRVGEGGAKESVREAHDALARLMRHEHASLALAQRCSAVAEPTPLFSALLNYRHTRPSNPSAGVQRAWAGVEFLGENERSNYPLILCVSDSGDALGLMAQVAAPVDPERICMYMQTALEQLVDALDRAPDTPVRKLDVLPATERRQLVVDWNATEAPYPAERCLHELFEAQAAKAPESVAVAYEHAQLTYGELDAQANRLGRYLRGLGVGPDTRVGLCVERSLEMVVALFAVLKAGGAYVPLDPSYPLERLRYMLGDSAPLAVLTHGAVPEPVQEMLQGSGVAIIDLQRDAARWANESASSVDRSGLTPEHLAYVIYTSGTTGTPKGVMVEHRNLTNYVAWATAAYSPDNGSVVSSSLAFDATVTSMFVPLNYGSTVRLLPEKKELDSLEARVNGNAGSGLIKITPTHLDSLGRQLGARHLSGTNVFVIGGESLSPSTVNMWREAQPGLRLVNEYGPTEATVGCIAYELPHELVRSHVVPIGRPISNARIYLLDGYGQPVPIGVAGEVYIGGAGVARGYLNRPELTAERFVRSPFVAGDRLYKTGDLARYLPDGNIEYLGRNDFQVKIRGFRIELGEVEARLREHDPIRDVVVIAREDVAGEKRLVAYYTVRDGGQVSVESLRLHLLDVLPEYMVPAAYVRMEALPLTPSGKLDRTGLPAPEGSAYVARAYEAPVGEVEQTIARIWSEVLKVEGIGRHDDFFELGGHSLLAVRVLSRVRRELQVELSLTQLFANPELCEVGQVAAGATRSALPAITKIDRGELPAGL